jgi:multidrug efflux pump subunit AcrA (membrane-fusion protein)
VNLKAYQDQAYKGRLRQIFPSADRAKAIVEVRVSILNPDGHVKPEMTASVTFQEPGAARGRSGSAAGTEPSQSPAPVVLVPKRAVTEQNSQSIVWVVTGGTSVRRPVTLGAERIDQVELKSGAVPGETVILNPPATLTDRGIVRVKGS